MTTIQTPSENIHTVFLNAGDFYFGGGQTRLSTLLGSCVSITLWHPRKRIGGMCHYMMAERSKTKPGPLDARYASDVFQLFLRHIEEAGTRPSEYQAKMFGGGNMMAEEKNKRIDIGTRNVEYARCFLSEHNITLISSHVGGSGRRRLRFDLWSGDVWLAFPEGKNANVHSINNERSNG